MEDIIYAEHQAIREQLFGGEAPSIQDQIDDGYLKIETSRIPNAGLGVFATSIIPAGECIDLYSGEIIMISKDNNNMSGEYLMDVSPSGYYVDAEKKEFANITRFINHAVENDANCRVQYFQSPESNLHIPVIITKREIAKGEELLYNYGKYLNSF